MRVLWVINNILPEVAEYIKKNRYNSVNISNSWTSALFEGIKEVKSVELAVAVFYQGDKFLNFKKDNVVYFAIPRKKNAFKYDHNLNSYLKLINAEYCPDIIHIHGTEYPHAYNVTEVFDSNKIVVSIQGLVSVIARYYTSGILNMDIAKNITLRNVVFGDSIWGQKKTFAKRGEFEKRVIGNVKYALGRTLWDKVHVLEYNPKATYFHLDEILREEFYKSRKWNYSECNKHTIFISQSNYPIKGLHMMLRALICVKKEYPDVKLRIAGKRFLDHATLKDKLKYSGYSKYLNSIIRKNGLEENIEFTGPLDANGMISEYLAANVYVCPSNIENSPNSMCEAQLLGVPCVLSFCGGVYDMTDYGQSANIYRFEEYEILAYYVKNIFKAPELESEKIQKGINITERRHSKELIISDLVSIYSKISHGENC